MTGTVVGLIVGLLVVALLFSGWIDRVRREDYLLGLADRNPQLYLALTDPLGAAMRDRARWEARQRREEDTARELGKLEILMEVRRLETAVCLREGLPDPHQPPGG